MRTSTKTRLSADQIQAMVVKHLGEEVKGTSELTDGMFNTAYLLEVGRPVVLKVAPPDRVPVLQYEKGIFRAEVEVTRLVAERTSAPVPSILAYDDSRSEIACDYYLMSFLPGTPLNKVRAEMSPEALRRTAFETGRYLREINAIEGSSYGIYSQASHSTWREAFRWLFERLLEDGRSMDVDLPYRHLQSRLEALLPLLDSVRQSRLVHWDLWDGNIFVVPETGEVTGIIDFERALWGDPLMEINFMNASEGFIEGYGANLALGEDAARVRRLYTIYLSLVGIIEAPYREYESKEAWQWAAELFKKEIDLL